MWPGLVQTAKEGGVDVIETYVFWNGHEPSQGNVSAKRKSVSMIHLYFQPKRITVIIFRSSDGFGAFFVLFFGDSTILVDDMIWSSL